MAERDRVKINNISVRPSAEVRELLGTVVDATGQKVSTVVNDLLEEFLPEVLRRRSEKLQAALKRFEIGNDSPANNRRKAANKADRK